MSETCNHDCGSCSENCESRQNPVDFIEKPHTMSSIKKVIGVVSGKGGVGKSLVTAMSAVTMNRRGYAEGILAADITGPSIPKLFGIHEKAMSNEWGPVSYTHLDVYKRQVESMGTGTSSIPKVSVTIKCRS